MTAVAVLAALSFPGGSFVTEHCLATRYPYVARVGVVRIPLADYVMTAPISAGGDVLELIPVDQETDIPSTEGIQPCGVRMTYLAASPVKGGGWVVIDTLETTMPCLDVPFAFWTPGPCEITLSSNTPGSGWMTFTTWEMADSGFVVIEETQLDVSLENLQAAEEKLASGNILGATHSLLCVMYPEQYFDPGEMAGRFLLASYYESLELFMDGDLDEALEVYFDAGEAYVACGLDSLWFIDPEGLADRGNPIGAWMSDEQLVEILISIATVADEARDLGAAELAREAAAVLR